MTLKHYAAGMVPAVLTWMLLSASGPITAEQTPLRIMPLGDSITQGYRYGYRRALWLALEQAGIETDFVGSMSRGHIRDSQAQDFDGDHEGHWGYQAETVLARIDEWAARARPDIVLMHLGTNDVGRGRDGDETAGEIARIIQRLRRHNPGIHVLLAAIIPVAHDLVSRRITRFNDALADLAAAIDSPASRVLLIDHFAGFDAGEDTFDGVHPNNRGNRKMADKWLAAIQSILPGAVLLTPERDR